MSPSLHTKGVLSNFLSWTRQHLNPLFSLGSCVPVVASSRSWLVSVPLRAGFWHMDSLASGSVHGDGVASTLLPLQFLTSFFCFPAVSLLPVLVRCYQLLYFSLANFSLLLVHNLLCGVTPALASSPAGPHGGFTFSAVLGLLLCLTVFPMF